MPPKTHHTPKGFRNNYVGTVTKSLGDLLRWQFDRIRRGLPPPATIPTPAQPPDVDFVKGNAKAGQKMTPAVTGIGHATALVQASGLNVLTDPIFSLRASPLQFLGPARAQPPGIALADLPHIDVVLISHNHYDHLDRRSIFTPASNFTSRLRSIGRVEVSTTATKRCGAHGQPSARTFIGFSAATPA